jgi:hypothetical protein
MHRLMTRLTQGQRGTLGVVQTQAVHRHELAIQDFIKRLMQRLLLPEWFIARYGWGLRQQGELALKFKMNRVEMIAPAKSPEALWLSLQAKLPGLRKVPVQEEQLSVQEKPLSVQEKSIPHPSNPETQVRKHLISPRAEDSTATIVDDQGLTFTTVGYSAQNFPLRSAESNSEVVSEHETFRVRRVPRHSTDRAEMQSLLYAQSGEEQSIADTHHPPKLQNAITVNTTVAKSIVHNMGELIPNSPMKVASKPTLKPITKANLVNTSASHPLQSELTRTSISQYPTDHSQHPASDQPKLLLSNSPTRQDDFLKVSLKGIQYLNTPLHLTNIVELRTHQSSKFRDKLERDSSDSTLLKPTKRNVVNPKNISATKFSREQNDSNVIATAPSFPLTKPFAQSPPKASSPLPLAIPKRNQIFESRDLPMEIETSANLQNITYSSPGKQLIQPTPQMMSPIHIQKITEQVSRQIFCQLRLERERRGIRP